MRGGTIHVKGNIASFAGVHMKDGTIIINGNAGMRIGAEMTGGTIIVLGKIEKILPGFSYQDTVDDVKVDEEVLKGPFLKFVGDLVENGKGTLLSQSEKNQDLL